MIGLRVYKKNCRSHKYSNYSKYNMKHDNKRPRNRVKQLLEKLKNNKALSKIDKSESLTKSATISSNDILLNVTSDSIQTASKSAPDVEFKKELSEGPDFQEHIRNIRTRELANPVNIVPRYEDPGQQFTYKYLKTKNFIVWGAMRKKKVSYLRRITYFSGANSFFPFSQWINIFERRALDIESGSVFFDNDVVYSTEGICVFFELDYVSLNAPVSEEEIVQHSLVCQDILKEYFHSNPDVNYRMWVLICEPNIKEKTLPKQRLSGTREVISNGVHVIFPNIIIDHNQGHQLCASLNSRIRKKFGRVVVDDCYKEQSMLRPMYSVKLKNCVCVKEKKKNGSPLPYGNHCSYCNGRGKVKTGSIYKPKYLISSNGEQLKEELHSLINNNLAKVVIETSIVAETDTGTYTTGYKIPVAEPLFITGDKRSTHVQDIGNDFMFKVDRKTITRLTKNSELVTNTTILKILKDEIRNYHTAYIHAELGTVYKKKTVYFVNLISGGRSFCRICNVLGHQHQSNRIFFKFDLRGRSIVQHCYDPDCKVLHKQDAGIKKRLMKTFNTTYSQVIFSEFHTFHHASQ